MKMKFNGLFTLSLTIGLILSSITLSAQGELVTRNLKGSWLGVLKVQSTELRLVMNIDVNASDSMIVTLDSPDQGARDLPTHMVTIKGDSLFILLRTIAGKYIAKVSPDYKTMTGLWKQGGMSLPLNLTKQASKVSVNRPQEPKPPFAYKSVDVRFPNQDARVELAGTLTFPEASGRYPAVILITGSGPQNRNEELMGHKPFLVLADYLTRQGFAVLRYDDRGVGQSTGDFKTATTFDFASDAASAVAYLKKRTEIDTNRIGLIGHSEGGLVAPLVASQRRDIAFVVLMAGPGIPGEEILLLQAELISRAEGTSEKSISESTRHSKAIYSVLKKTPDNAKADVKIRKIVSSYNDKHANDTTSRPMTETELTAQINSLTSAWFRCFLTFNPQEYLSKVSCPLLAINGSLDLQVPSKENLQAIEKALIFGGNSSYMTEELPGLNHLFQTAATGSPTEYAKIEETISPAALDLLGKWLQKNVQLTK